MNRSQSTFLILVILIAAVAAGCSEEKTDSESHSAIAEADFCVEHDIAESQCPYCRPELVETLGFCHGHGVPEAFCYLCNPALIPAFKAVGDWCGGHDRPESQCYICNPELDPFAQEEVAAENTTVKPSVPPVPLTRRQQPPSLRCANEDLVVRLETAEVADIADFQVAQVELRALSKTIQCNARIQYNGNHFARLASQVPGKVTALHGEPGDEVEPGDALATIISAKLGSAKAAFLQSATAVDLWQRNQIREKELLAQGVATERDLIEAEISLAESRIALGDAQQVLFGLGLSAEQIEEVRLSNDTSSAYTLTAPMAGVIVDRFTALGEVVETARPLFSVADVSSMWAMIDVYESDLGFIHPGQEVVLQVEGLPGEVVGGWVTWVSSELDPRTRTLTARAEISNPGARLLANMFARAEVKVADRRNSLVVPTSAVQWEGCCNMVFVRQSPTVYEPRKVHLGIASGNVFEVLNGLQAGDEVVTVGSYLLKTEILKGSIGAGCCEVEPGT